MVYAILGLLVLGGVIIILQGLRVVQGKRRFRQDAVSRLIPSSLSDAQEDTRMKVDGVLRMALGGMFVAVGQYLAWTIM